MIVVNDDEYYNRIKSLNISHYSGEISYYTRAPLRLAEKTLLASIPKGSKILDLGCGSGRFSIGAAQMGHYVTGIDITPNAITAAVNKSLDLNLGNVRFLVGDMTNIPFLDKEFDYVFCPRFSINAVSTFHRRQKAVREMRRVVKSGGTVYVESFNKWYLGKGPQLVLRNIIVDVWRYTVMTRCWIFQQQYTGLLPGDITYKANKVATASIGYAHLPSIIELKKMIPAEFCPTFYSIPQIVSGQGFDVFKFFRYSIWASFQRQEG